MTSLSVFLANMTEVQDAFDQVKSVNSSRKKHCDDLCGYNKDEAKVFQTVTVSLHL